MLKIRKLKDALLKETNLYKEFSQSKNNLHTVQETIKSFIASITFEGNDYTGDAIVNFYPLKI